MKSIHTLIKDINHVVEGKDRWFDESLAEGFSGELGLRLLESFAPRDKVPGLRLSAMGEGCPRSLWASVHSPSSQEPLQASVRVKFAYGHMIEALALAMAKAAGHSVLGEQDELQLLGVKGHRDCVLDGCIVDVKSANSLSFQKIQNKAVMEDYFLRKYLDQLDSYAVASADDGLVHVKDKAYLFAIDKTLGHMTLYEHRVRPDHIKQRVADYKAIVASEHPPACTCKTMPFGASGNICLDTPASYNPFKYYCFPHLRKFLYKGKPVYLTRVTRMPKDHILEVDQHGNIVYNNVH